MMSFVVISFLILSIYADTTPDHTRTIEFISSLPRSSIFWTKAIDPFRNKMIKSGFYTQEELKKTFDFSTLYFYISCGFDYLSGKTDPKTGGYILNTTTLYPYAFMYNLILDSDHPDRKSTWNIYEYGYMIVAKKQGIFGGLLSGIEYNINDMLFVTDYNLVDTSNKINREVIFSQSRRQSNLSVITTYAEDKRYSTGLNTVTLTNGRQEITIYGTMDLTLT